MNVLADIFVILLETASFCYLLEAFVGRLNNKQVRLFLTGLLRMLLIIIIPPADVHPNLNVVIIFIASVFLAYFIMRMKLERVHI